MILTISSLILASSRVGLREEDTLFVPVFPGLQEIIMTRHAIITGIVINLVFILLNSEFFRKFNK
jgi:hypothetical protein